MTKYFAVLSIISLAACSHPKPAQHGNAISNEVWTKGDGIWVKPTCSEGSDLAALHEVGDRFWDVENSETRRELDCKRAEWSQLKKWANALPEATEDEYCVKQGYLNWLDYYDGHIKQGYEKVAAKEANNPREESWQRQARITREYLATHEVPTPPNYNCER